MQILYKYYTIIRVNEIADNTIVADNSAKHFK